VAVADIHKLLRISLGGGQLVELLKRSLPQPDLCSSHRTWSGQEGSVKGVNSRRRGVLAAGRPASKPALDRCLNFDIKVGMPYARCRGPGFT
jgi:hypothetical protein